MKTEYTISATDADLIVRLYDTVVDGLDWSHMSQGEIDYTNASMEAIFRLFQQMEKGE